MTLSQQISFIENLDRKRELEDIAIQALLGDYDRAETKGQTGYMRYIISQLDALGYDRDYLPADHGTGHRSEED